MDSILVIDDERNIRYLLSKTLSFYGFKVVEAENGEEGIACLGGDEKFKAVITDIRLPKKNGNYVARYIRDNDTLKGIIIIGLTGYVEDAEEELFDFLLSKPYKIKEIVRIIEES